MRRYVRIDRPQRRTTTARLVRHGPVVSRTVARADITVARREYSPASSLAAPEPNPYVDYGRFLTAEGGILIVYKDTDLPFWKALWRFLVWMVCTGAEAWFLLNAHPFEPGWLNIACLCAVAVINWLILLTPPEVQRRIEIRPDCMIIDGADIFWRRYMESWPDLKPDDEGNQVLCGIYGTRFVEYLTVRRFDELDRAPEVFAAHLQDAMQQLWTVLR